MGNSLQCTVRQSMCWRCCLLFSAYARVCYTAHCKYSCNNVAIVAATEAAAQKALQVPCPHTVHLRALISPGGKFSYRHSPFKWQERGIYAQNKLHTMHWHWHQWMRWIQRKKQFGTDDLTCHLMIWFLCHRVPVKSLTILRLCPLRPANLLLDRSSSEVPSAGTMADWMDGMRTLPCKEAFSGVSYSSCDTLAKTSTE